MKNLLSTALAVGGLFFSMLCSAQSVDGKVGEHDYVDLGLPSGTKWATYNVGATKPTEAGTYFAWGETKPRKIYDVDNHKWAIYDFEKKMDKFIKYNKKDGLWTLEGKDDAAKSKFGKLWYTPSKEDAEEMINACNWEWVENYNNSGMRGALGTSKANGHTIFIPVAGFIEGKNPFTKKDIQLWTSTLMEEDEHNTRSFNSYIYTLYENRDGVVESSIYGRFRFIGLNCRAVTK